MSSVFAQVEDMLAAGAEDLFACYGTSSTAVRNQHPAETDEEKVVATIGWACEDGSRGNLLMVAPRSVIEHLQPPEEGMVLTNADICDVLGEFSNMLLGRLKNMLLQKGVALMLSTPTTVLVKEPWFSTPLGRWSWMAFDMSVGSAHVRLDATFTEEFVLSEERSALAPELAEGEMMLF